MNLIEKRTDLFLTTEKENTLTDKEKERLGGVICRKGVMNIQRVFLIPIHRFHLHRLHTLSMGQSRLDKFVEIH